MKGQINLVAVGASAGGLDALVAFFKSVPADCEAAFVVIQHLSPEHKSMMGELLAPHLKLPIEDATDQVSLSPGRVYLCPPAYIPKVNGMVLRLLPRPKGEVVTSPINVLFTSMARTIGAHSAAVVLSGTGSDGSQGVAHVSRSGGLVAVQMPSTAEFNGMPQSAISTGCADVIAPPSEIWQLIAALARGETIDPAYRALVVPDLGEDQLPEFFDEGPYQSLFKHLNKQFGLNFSLYCINSVSRRLKRRMDLLGISEIDEYQKYIDSNGAEAEGLYNDLLIGVTEFFRDDASFEAMAKQGLQSRMQRSMETDLRIWVAGCATGEEAYSIYIMADEIRQKIGFKGRITIFATDVFGPSIEKAGKGVYSAKKISKLSKKRQANYFQKVDGALFKAQSHMRENIIFAQHNFLEDAPFINIDLVSCRNVLIYLKPKTQKMALAAFSYALNDQGTLFLGSSESLGEFGSSFEALSNKYRIFCKHGDALDSKQWRKGGAPLIPPKKSFPLKPATSSITINRQLLSAYDSLLSRFAPSGFLINGKREVLHYFGDAANFCIHVEGRVSADVLEQIDKNLKLIFKALIQRSTREKARTTSNGVRCQSGSGKCIVDLAVEPLGDFAKEPSTYLLEINPRSSDQETPSDQAKSVKPISLDARGDFDAATQIKMLEDELNSTRENLEAANEELQVSNEELQSMNEELQVSNEEMQVSSEELQSTNEELRSLNQELSTFNREYERKNEELISVNSSHENLLESTDDGVLYVDRDLCIRQFNSAIHSAFKLMQSDIGRPLSQIAYRMQGDVSLEVDVRHVLETGERVVRESDSLGGRYFIKRIVPFRGSNGEIEGALLSFTDITEKHRLEERFNFALKTAGISWWELDVPTGEMRVSSAGACLLGDECLCVERSRQGWVDRVHPDDREMVEQTLNACLQGVTTEWYCEHRFKTDSGEWLWVQNQGMVLSRNADGEPLEMMGTTRDINDYKLALEEARGQRDLLEIAGEIALLGNWDYDPSTNQVEWSSQTRKILAVGDDFDPSVDGTFDFILPPDNERLEAAFKKAVEEGVPYDLELQCVDRNGRHCIVRASGRPRVDANGKVVRVVGIFQEVTEILRREHEMSAFFKVSPDFQATATLEGKFKSYNNPWELELGYTHEDLNDMSLCEVVVPEERTAFENMLKQVVAGETFSSYETRVLSQKVRDTDEDPKDVWLSWSVSSDPELRFIVVSARCVTEQKETQHSLQEARIRAEQASRAKSDFLAIMSHELRTPLNPILGYTEMLLEETEDEEEREIFKTISESGTHMLNMIDELLQYGKINAGKMKAEPVEFSLVDFSNEVIHLMKGMLRGDDCTLNHSIDWGELDPESAPVMTGDVGMLRQVLRNLISNAIKFTDTGRIDYKMCILKASEGKATVEFSVADTGIGIAPADLKKLFQPFEQADAGMTRKYGGTGLGLAICKSLVELMGGQVSAMSELGKGSTFTVQLPLDYEIEDRGEKAGGPEKSSDAKDAVKGLNGRVLIVEDNDSNALYIQKLIEKEGLAFDVVSNGEEALEVVAQKDFNLILLDLHMPGIGGIETLKKLRATESGKTPIPVVILTADVSESSRLRSEEAGANEVIAKPVRPSSMSQLLRKFLV